MGKFINPLAIIEPHCSETLYAISWMTFMLEWCLDCKETVKNDNKCREFPLKQNKNITSSWSWTKTQNSEQQRRDQEWKLRGNETQTVASPLTDTFCNRHSRQNHSVSKSRGTWDNSVWYLRTTHINVITDTHQLSSTTTTKTTTNYYYYYVCLMTFFQDNLGKLAPER